MVEIKKLYGINCLTKSGITYYFELIETKEHTGAGIDNFISICMNNQVCEMFNDYQVQSEGIFGVITMFLEGFFGETLKEYRISMV